MSNVLHIELKKRDSDFAELRYYFDDPNQYEPRTLELKSIRDQIEKAEAGYYSASKPDLIKIGQQLYDWLDSADRFLANAIEESRGEGVLTLAISTYKKLSHLPWEVLHDGTMFLVQQTNPHIVPVRWRSDGPGAYEPMNRPLRVLFMATSPLNVEPELNYEAEEGLILEATKKQPLSLIVEESGNLGELGDLTDSYGEGYFDIFHIIGHADNTEDGPRFLTETDEGEPYPASAEEFAGALHRKPRLVFLSGCHTGQAGEGGEVPSLAEGLIDFGFKTVLGWGRSVLDSDATKAAVVLYDNLSRGYEIVEAVSTAYRELIEANARDWHLLRLYVAGEMPGTLVTPLKTKGREKIEQKPAASRFLDNRQQIKVVDREGFVGRRRPLQRCLKSLKHDDTKIGVLIQGMGGLGKSSMAARLCDRLPSYSPIVWVGGIDEPYIIRELSSKILEQSAREALQVDDDLQFRLLNAFKHLNEPFLLVLDDFEHSLEKHDKEPVLRDGKAILTPTARHVLDALAFALEESATDHKLIVTCRYEFDASVASKLYHEQLVRFTTGEQSKKENRLQSKASKELKKQALVVADGNPRLIEWLFDIIGEENLDHKTILLKMAEKETEFREDVLAEQLLSQQTSELRKVLANMLVYELPVPMAAVEVVCEGIANLETHIERAGALGLLEIHRSEPHYRVPRVLQPLLEPEVEKDTVPLYRRAANALFGLWWEPQKAAREEQLLEIHRLGMAGREAAIAADMADTLAGFWTITGRLREAKTLCEITLQLAKNEHRLLNRLAWVEFNLGDGDVAVAHLQKAVKVCPKSDETMKGAINHNLANIYLSRGKIDEALKLYQQSLLICESIDNDQGKAAILHQMAVIYTREGKIDEALELYQKSLKIVDCIGEFQGQADTLHEMAVIYTDQGKTDKALKLFQKSIKIRESIGDVRGKTDTFQGMALICINKGKIDKALKLYQESLEIQESIGDVRGKATTLTMMAQLLAFVKGDFEMALMQLGESIAILEKIKSPDAEKAKEIWSQVKMAQIANRLGQKRTRELKKAIESGDQEKIKSLIAEADSQE